MHPAMVLSASPAVVARTAPRAAAFAAFGLTLRKLSTATGSTPSSSSTSSSSSAQSASAKRTRANFNSDPAFRPTARRGGKLARTLFLLGWMPVAAFITSHIYSLGNVSGGSMSPTFNGLSASASAANSRSDVVLLNRTVKTNHAELKAGDIVTLISPLEPRLLLTKRYPLQMLDLD